LILAGQETLLGFAQPVGGVEEEVDLSPLLSSELVDGPGREWRLAEILDELRFLARAGVAQLAAEPVTLGDEPLGLDRVEAVERLLEVVYRPTSGGGEALGPALAATLGLDLAVLRRRIGDELVDQPPSRCGDLVDCAGERFLVRLRRVREPADLAHVLKRGVPNLVVGRGRLEVEERLDVSAHDCILGIRERVSHDGPSQRPRTGG
jgi:hypothetical protein